MKKDITNGKPITYKTKFIDSFRFISSKLSDLGDNLSEKIHSDNCTDCKSYLDYMSVEDDQLIFRYFECKKNYKKDFNKDLINRFANTYEFCNGEINKFVLLLRKVVYLMNTWIVGKDSMKLPFQIKIFLQRIESKRHY